MGDALHTHGGVTDAREARLAQAGLIAVQGPSILDARTGVLAGPGSTALVTGTAATAPMTVAIAPHGWVTSRGAAHGPYLGALEAVTTPAIAAAPAAGAGTRIDVVYVKQQDSTLGVPNPDGTTAPLYGVVTGVAGGAKPALPVGAEELATVAVSPGATATNGANIVITNTARQTVARGGVLPVADAAERLALSAAGGAYDGLVVKERGTDRLYDYTGSAWRYIGGAPPPTAAVTMQANWTAGARSPFAFVDGSGQGHVGGQVISSNAFTPNGTQSILDLPDTVPVPQALRVYAVPLLNSTGPTWVSGYVSVRPDGLVWAEGSSVGAIGANSSWYLDGIDWHPTQPSSGVLS